MGERSEGEECREPGETAPHFLHKRRGLLLLAYVVFLVATAEGILRIGYFFADGLNPYYLHFGFVPDTEFHSYEEKGYSKFQPQTVKRQRIGDGVIRMQINAHGFRQTGRSDPVASEADIRVATLGASSTFGYYVEDDETYPAALERLLQGSYPESAVEVYNLGVPHLRIENIVALARRELPAIQPAVVTLYAGYNNISQPDRETSGQAYRLKDWLHFHSILYRSARPVLKAAYFSFVETTNRDVAQLEHLSIPVTLSREEIAAIRQEISTDFLGSLSELYSVTEELGSELMLITQNYNLKLRGGSGLNDRWRTYEEEVRLVEQTLEENDGLLAVQASLLVHHHLMGQIRVFAQENDLPLVDGIAAMSRDPSEMRSGVHLSALGNQWIAEAIHQNIVSLPQLHEGRSEE